MVNLSDNIPTIGNSQIDSNSTIKKIRQSDISLFDNAPNDISFWTFFWKFIIWWIVWLCVAALLLWTLSIIWSFTNSDNGSSNSLLWVLLPIIWFIVWFVWNIALAWLYNLFFSKRYYSFWKMFWLIFASSIIIFIFLFPIFLLFKGMNTLYTILWFQIIFQLFISINLIDFLSQPNYSASSLIWNTLWFVLAVIAFLWITQSITWESTNMIIPIIISSVISYAIMIFGAGIWDAIYYKFYEWWNNPFYLPSLSELRAERQKEEFEKSKDEQEINVDM